LVRSICIVGAGRVGSALAARLRGRGLDVRTAGRELATGDAELVLLCVPDRAIAECAATIARGPWLAHTSGATSLADLHPHERRFSLHPLQTIVRSRGPEQLAGAWAAVTAESDEARALARELAELLGLHAFELADDARVLYHAGAAVASNYLVTIYRAAAELFEAADFPPEALVPLMTRTIENGFELTGPIARGDWQTVEAHLDAIRERTPQLEPMYTVLADATRALVT
jgi:predicted short-subunit dehydrogenase-like oxidoreductase (DUF2520 family)